ncbi:MAG: sigma-70 family RNA polymerase sigma factor [Lachnospiraceae bacterium]|nr:sigma-70 family RNA polymerase sigma factor [Lachnospiraceae bacterium]
MKQYEKLVYSICFKTTKNQFDAQDLTQETFLSAYKNLDHFDRAHERAWICRIASNKALDYLKSSQRRVICEEDSFFADVTDIQAGPEESYLQHESKQYVIHVCKELKSPYQEIALAHFYEEKTAAQIAAEQGKNLKTIQTQIYRAKAMIKKIMEGGTKHDRHEHKKTFIRG